MKKTGFTLAELVISMAIIGVITTTAILTFKPFDRGIKYLYTNTYYALERAFYSTMITFVPQDRDERDPFIDKYNKNGSEKTLDKNAAALRLCIALEDYINTNDVHCNQNYDNLVGPNPDANTFSTKTPMLVANNGVRFWISPRMETQSGVKFFIVYADLNGRKIPNSLNYQRGNGPSNKTIDPDVFAFAAMATDNSYRICPLGIPEFDERYLTARIRYKDQNSNIMYSTESVPLAYAKAQAWGYYILGQQEDDYNSITENSPLSYSESIRKEIGKNSPIYSFLNGGTSRAYFKKIYPYPTQPSLNENAPNVDANGNNSGGFGCKAKSDEECEVIVDRYHF